jgi:8-oxo-dGTP pyrophosphatase MutT (NUDIX family)
MKKLIAKILEFFKLIPPIFFGNQPCYDKWGRFLGWYSRSMAVAVFIYCKDKNGRWNVLASERGKGTPDFQGYWNCVCGYVEMNTTIPENCVKEVHEELGIDISEKELSFIGFEDSPSANHQNVTFRYSVIYEDKTCDDFSFTHKWNEKDEVGKIMFIPLGEINKYKWAFGHEKRIIDIAKQKGLI